MVCVCVCDVIEYTQGTSGNRRNDRDTNSILCKITRSS